MRMLYVNRWQCMPASNRMSVSCLSRDRWYECVRVHAFDVTVVKDAEPRPPRAVDDM